MINITQKYYELAKEILCNLKAHKVRTLLTAFGIAWGIFILIVLLGVSGGVQNGIFNLFRGFTQKTLMFYGGESEDNTMQRDHGNDIRFGLSDLMYIKETLPNITATSSLIENPNTKIGVGSEIGFFNVKAINCQTFNLTNLDIKQGRKIHQRDIDDARRVCIIGDRINKKFFDNTDPLKKHIAINGFNFTIIGVIENDSFLSLNEQNSVFIPRTTYSETIRPIRDFKSFGVLVSDGDSKLYQEKISSFLAKKYHFDKNDNNALYVVNYEEQMSAFSKLFGGLDMFLVFVGFCLLLSGIIGIGNVMYIVVKERTNEIGVKKAIGASSVTLLKEFLFESILLTVLSGIIGLLLGAGVLKAINLFVSSEDSSEAFFTHTVLDLKYIILSLFILIVAGLVAGFLPAFKAANIKPVTAINAA